MAGQHDVAKECFTFNALDCVPNPLFAVDAVRRIRYVNRAAQATFLYAADEIQDRPLEILASPACEGRHRDVIGRLFSAAQHGCAGVRGDLWCRRKGDVDFPARASMVRMDAAAAGVDGAPEFLLICLTDETDRPLQAQDQMAALVASAEDAIITKTLDGLIQSWNPAAEQLLGYRAEEIIGKPIVVLIPEDRRDEENMILHKIRCGERVSHFETVRRRRDGTHVDVSLTISPIRNGAGHIAGASKIMRDITERKHTLALLESLNGQLQQQVRDRTAELKEREALLQEVHHRVKNNLQVISSLINLQARSLRDAAAESALRQCQSRVATMAQIHEMLYQAKSYAHMPFAPYARELTQRSLYASGAPSSRVTPVFRLEEIELPVEQAIPAALILNELIANCLKHAFPPGRSGIIIVSLTRMGGPRIALSVADDGVGAQGESALERPGSLGLHLVRTLARQLDGSLHFHFAGGMHCRLEFPVQGAS